VCCWKNKTKEVGGKKCLKKFKFKKGKKEFRVRLFFILPFLVLN
jgi:hypothetical protein